jgi:hypothetical protein
MFDFISEMWSDGPMGIVLLVLLFILVLFLLGMVALGADYIFGHDQQLSVIVVEKTYSPASYGSGIATGVTGNGQVGTGVVFTSSPEKFVLLVKDDAGEVFSHEVEPAIYASANKRDRIDITVRIGRFSNSRF